MDPQVRSVDRPPWVSAMSLPRGLDAALRLFDRYYILCMVPVSLLVLVLNYHAQGMQGVVPNYEDFKRIILAGFDPKAGIYGTPTFPMWGYGWLLLVTENKAALLVFQNALALLAVWIFIRALERRGDLPPAAVRLLKMLLVISLPWHAFHSLRWPHSVAISLFLVSFALFVEGIGAAKAQTRQVVLSGALFGLALNFRSDFIWMPIVLVTIMLVAKGWTRPLVGGAAVWLLAAYLPLVPWAAYAKRATGHYLLTSTNAGHVLFIGLGNLPDNKWGIVPSDVDPVMRGLIRERFGEHASSLTYPADRFLRGEFLRRILADPGEYVRKVLRSARLVVVTGAYAGEFFETPACQPACETRYWSTVWRLRSDPIAFATTSGLPAVRVVLRISSENVGRYSVLFSFLLLPLVVVLAWRQKSLFLLLVIAGILYQTALSVIAYHMDTYTSNMFFFHLVNLSVALPWLGAACRGR